MRPAKAIDYLWFAGLLLVVLVAVYLRFDGLAEPSLWLDEILHVTRAREAAAAAADGSWYDWFAGLPVDRENGPLYYATQLLALSYFEGEFAARLMPALAGVAAVLVLCFVGTAAIKDRFVGLSAGLLIAVSPLHVHYSREGRPYAAIMLAASLMLLVALQSQRRWARCLVYPICLATAYLGAIAGPLLAAFFGFACLSWWLSRRRGGATGQGHLILASGLALCILPILFPTVQGIDQVSGEVVERAAHSAGLEITRPLSSVALDRLVASLTVSGLDSGSTTAVSWLGLILALAGGLRLFRRDASAGLWSVGLWLLPIAGWMAALHHFDHWYNVRYTSVGLPAFLLLVAVGAADVGGRVGSWVRRGDEVLRPLAIGVCLSILVFPAWVAARTEPWQKPPWRDVADLLGTLATEDEVIVARESWSYDCLDYYLNQLGHPVELINADFSEQTAREAMADASGAFVVAAGYHQAPWLETWLGSLHPLLRRSRANLRVYYSPDFATLFSGQERRRDLKPILARLGQPAEVQEFTEDGFLVGAGWSVPEREPGGRTFRWAAAERAEIALTAPNHQGRRSLRLLAMPFPSPDRPPQRVRISVNGEFAGEVRFEPGWNDLTLGSYASSREVDFVTLDFDWLQSPRDLDPDSPDDRRLAVAFDRLESVAAFKTPI